MPNYEEFVGKAHLCNAPYVFDAIWWFVQSFLDEATLAKTAVHGRSVDLTAALLRDIPLGIGADFPSSRASHRHVSSCLMRSL